MFFMFFKSQSQYYNVSNDTGCASNVQTLTLSTLSQRKYTTNDLGDLVTSDTHRVMEVCRVAVLLAGAPVQVCRCVCMCVCFVCVYVYVYDLWEYVCVWGRGLVVLVCDTCWY